MKPSVLSLAMCLAFAAAGACHAQNLKATQRLSDTQLGFDPGGNYANYTLTVIGPNGFQANVSSKTGAPVIDLRRFGAFDDGVYHYQLTASTDEKVTVRTALDNGRAGGAAGTRLKGVALGGHFEVKGGVIVKVDPNAREETKRQN